MQYMESAILFYQVRPSVLLTVCPFSIVKTNGHIVTLFNDLAGHHSSFLSSNVVTKFQVKPPQRAGR